MRTRSVAVVLAAFVAVSGVSAPAVAAPKSAKPVKVASKVVKSTKVTKPVKKLTPVATTYSGALTALDVDARTLTLLVEGGNNKKDRGLLVTVVVAETAEVSRDGVAALLSDFSAGESVELKGTRTGTAPVVVTKVSYTSPVVEEPLVEEPSSDPVV